jgi:hypothetical protein
MITPLLRMRRPRTDGKRACQFERANPFSANVLTFCKGFALLGQQSFLWFRIVRTVAWPSASLDASTKQPRLHEAAFP